MIFTTAEDIKLYHGSVALINLKAIFPKFFSFFINSGGHMQTRRDYVVVILKKTS